MDNKEIVLTLEMMRKIARYELTFEKYLHDAKYGDITIVCPESYGIQLDDLLCALSNMKEKNPTIGEIGNYWLYPVNQLSDVFIVEDDGLDNPYRGLNIYDFDYVNEILIQLETAWEEYENDVPFKEISEMDELIDELNRYYMNRHRPVMERKFPDWEMINYIYSFDEDDTVNNATEDQLILARRFIDILCEKDNERALRIKGYACYGGNRLYNCDWYVSRDCMERLYDLTDDPNYANTLGYIYYYGRCNKGIPEYDKAFKCFEISAANGFYEGTYKLADMYRHGYGCKQSLRTAKALYSKVYHDSINQFKRGFDANFADIAVRMGNLAAEKEDYPMAYHYYLEGAYAAKIRAESHDYYGSASMAISAQKSLESTKERLPEGFLKEYVDYEYPRFFMVLSSDNNLCELSKTIDDEGHIKLNATRIPTFSVPDVENILLVVPELSLCERTKEVTYYLDGSAQICFIEETESIRFDYCEDNWVDNRFEFYKDEKVVAWVKSDLYRIYAKKDTEAYGKEVHLASIRFTPSGRIYDYIYEDTSIKEGDFVVVESYDGETEVEVVKIITKKESELALPVNRYKKIIRKV
ncbi:MAG: sel1 repeat family protein [Faecalicoccus sp.]|nr:sel1 repeat family protein [Faecalicoccus sp.]